MFRYAIAGLAMATLVGCGSSGGGNEPVRPWRRRPGQLAAYAASSHYPGDVKPSSESKLRLSSHAKGR